MNQAAVSRHPYADFLAKVAKPSRYVGGEVHQVRKDWSSVSARVCLAFPDLYDVGMSHLGTKILYGVLNKHPQVACERAFAPWVDMEAELRARDLPVLSLESCKPLADFDVLGFSLQYELTYTNVLNLLDLSGLPLRAKDRGSDEPLILAGGPTATHPEPLAPFVDAFFIGEAEEHLPALCLAFSQMRAEGVPRTERLIRLSEQFPLYVPELYETEVEPDSGFVVVGAPKDPRVPARPKRVWVEDINRFPFPDDSPLPYAEAVFDRMAVEIARGCTEGCRFCQAGMIYRPIRERDPVSVLDSLVEGARKGGYDETSLTSLSTADYSCVTPLVKAAMARLRDEKVSLSVSSLRAYGLNDDLLADMATMKAQGLTFAPEAGTQRMRDVITKNVTEEDITESAHRVFSRGFQRMKLYFMIGLPTEEDEDVRGIVETAARVRSVGRKYLQAAQVVASVSTHVPKPHTPFQWAAMDTEADTRRKQKLLADTARALRVDLKMHENHQSHLEGVFARGDRRVGDWLEAAFKAGCRFDGWEEQLRLDLWDQALETVQQADPDLEPGRYLGTIAVTSRLPWDHIDIALEPDFLLREYRKSLKNRLSPPCGKPFKEMIHPTNVAAAQKDQDRKLVCYHCGVACDLSGMKEERLYFLRRMNAWTEPPAPPPGRSPNDPQVPKRVRASNPKPRFIDQGTRRKVRLRYTKLGPVVYLGHLDLVRHLPRVFRRADVDLYYTNGFRARPEMTFGPALPLGVPSLAEVLDVSLTTQLDPAQLVQRLNACSLEGVRFTGAAWLEPGDRPIGRAITRATYVVRFQDATAAAHALARFHSKDTLSVVRASTKKGRRKRETVTLEAGRTIDVRKHLLSVSVVEDTARSGLERQLGWPASETASCLLFSLRVEQSGQARPREVIEALLGADAVADSEFARVGLYVGDPLSSLPAGDARCRVHSYSENTGVAGVDVLRTAFGVDPLDVAWLRAQHGASDGSPKPSANAEETESPAFF